MRTAALILPLIFAAAAGQGATPAECWEHKRLGRAQAATCFLELDRSPDPAIRAEGLWGLKNHEAANNQFKLAIKQHPKDPNVRVRWGRLFLVGFNKEEAAKLFEEALELQKDNADALLGLALVASEGYDKMAVTRAKQALEKNPKLLEAQELLARLAVEDGDFKKAREEADKAISMHPQALGAMAIHATLDLLADKNTTWFEPILKINPRCAAAFTTAGDLLVLNRRYREAIDQYKKAVELDPDHLEAWSEMGINLMRLGEENEARMALERAYNGRYRNAATVNSLRLIDSYKNFLTYKYDRFILRLHKREAELLKPYFEEQMQRILATYDRKYGFRLPEVVQVEVYPDHEDFAVRTVGMPGLGALGVTFGNIVAMDSPSGKKPGSFHWASTLWHEMSHVYTIHATRHRIPRWYTEGLAVYEETATSPEWGDRVDPLILAAIKDKKLLPVTELERGFVRPAFPAQVLVSYFQAGRMIEFIEKKWGHEKVLAMMKAFAQAQVSTAEVIEKVLGVKPADFDREFVAEVEKELKPLATRVDAWRKEVADLNLALKNKQFDAVLQLGPALRDEYKDFVESGNVYEALAAAYEAKNDKAGVMRELGLYAKAGGRNPATLKKLALLQEEAGQKKAAAETLNRINLIYPVQEEEVHAKLGNLYVELGDLNGAIREFRAVIFSKPVDPASSRYNLARALAAAKRFDEAQEEVLNALETAPGYKPAQKLLLELNSRKN